MRKINPNAKKAMKLVHTEGITLKEAWKRVKSVQSARKSTRKSTRKSARKSKRKSFGRRRRKLRSAKNSLKLNRIKLRKRRSKKCSKKSSKRKFGMSKGPGYVGQTSFSNAYAPYFGNNAEPYVNASSWWYPVTGGKIQSPQMLMKI